jgi:hypothetical protein
MLDEGLKDIERVNQFHYPPMFWGRWQEFASLAKTEWFRATYPAARLVSTQDEVWAARLANDDLPDDLIPFMILSGQQFPDYYGFQVPRRPVSCAGELPVLVWCIHTYIHGWDAGFSAFLDELQAQHAKQRQADAGVAPDPAGM